MTSPVSVTIEDGIATILIDNPPVNATSQAVRQGILDASIQSMPMKASRPQCWPAPAAPSSPARISRNSASRPWSRIFPTS
jgi:hypothetical protein